MGGLKTKGIVKHVPPTLNFHRVVARFVIGKPKCVLDNTECDEATQLAEKKIQQEMRDYSDILRVDHLDTYEALVYKVCCGLRTSILLLYNLNVADTLISLLDKRQLPRY